MLRPKLFVSLLLFAAATSTRAAGPTITIDAGSSSANVSRLFYGLMTEEIDHSYDGGLYAELVRNRAFLDDAGSAAHWAAVQGDGAAAAIALDKSQPLNDTLPTSLRVEVTQASKGHAAGVANEGYWGIPVKPDTRYHASFYAKAAPGFGGPVTVSIQSNDGTTTFASGTVSGLGTAWKQYEVTLQTGRVTPTTAARYVLTVERPGTVWFSLASLFPPTFNNQPNGFRPDIMQMMVDMKPKFLRFPGGNFLEGDQIADRFEWKKTLGPLAGRPGHVGPWSYRSTDGLGLYEFLLWAEDMGAEPLLAVYAGYSLKGVHVNPGPDLEPYVQDALDEIEYVTGPATSKWGALRAKAGHPPALQADLRRGRQRGLVRQVRFVRSAVRTVQPGDQGALSAAQGDFDRRVRAARGAARAQHQTGRGRRALLPHGRRVPEDGARPVRGLRPARARDLRRRMGRL